MKDYIFNKQIPFVTEQSENSNNKIYKYLTRGMGITFGNDQRNVVLFAFALGIPGIILAFTGLIMTSWGHPILMLFDLLLTAFIGWVFWSMFNMYKEINEFARKSEENKNQIEE